MGQRAQPPSRVTCVTGNCPPIIRGEEGGVDVKSAWPLCPGLHTCYNGQDNGLRTREGELIPQTCPQWGLQAATRLHERGIGSNRGSAMPR